MSEAVLTHPHALGYEFSNWTTRLARHHVRVRFGKIVSARTLARVLHQQGLTLVRPRTVPAKGDPAEQQRCFDELRERIQHARPGERFIFVDACSVEREATITRMWWRKGERPEVKMCAGKDKAHVYGMLDATGNAEHFMFVPRVNSEHFQRFLVSLTWLYPHDHLVVILDNGPPHRSGSTRDFVGRLGGQVELFFLPPYSPRLNPIEKFWTRVRKRVTHNTFFATFKAFMDKLVATLLRYTEPNEIIHNLCKIYYRKGHIPVSSL